MAAKMSRHGETACVFAKSPEFPETGQVYPPVPREDEPTAPPAARCHNCSSPPWWPALSGMRLLGNDTSVPLSLSWGS